MILGSILSGFWGPFGSGTPLQAPLGPEVVCKRPVSCGILAGISAQQCEAGVLDLFCFWLPQLGPNGQGEVLGIFF